MHRANKTAGRRRRDAKTDGAEEEGRRKKRFRFQVSSLSLMNHQQTERHNNAIGGSLRFTRVCDSPEGHYDTPVLSENAAKIHLFMEKKGRWLK